MEINWRDEIPPDPNNKHKEDNMTQMATQEGIHGYLVARYGPLMTIEEVAELLRRSPKSLATSLTMQSRRDDPWLAQLRGAKVRIGRRRLFRADLVAALIDQGAGK